MKPETNSWALSGVILAIILLLLGLYYWEFYCQGCCAKAMKKVDKLAQLKDYVGAIKAIDIADTKCNCNRFSKEQNSLEIEATLFFSLFLTILLISKDNYLNFLITKLKRRH